MTIDLRHAKELDPNKTYLIYVKVGDLPAEKLQAVVTQIDKQLKEKNIDKTIFVPVKKDNIPIAIKDIDEQTLNKTLKQFLEEKFHGVK